MMILDWQLVRFNEHKRTSHKRLDNLDRLDNLVSVMNYDLLWRKLPNGLPDNVVTSNQIRAHIVKLRELIERCEFKLNKSRLYYYHMYLQIVLYLKTKMRKKFIEMHNLINFAKSLTEHFRQKSKTEYHLGKALEEAQSEEAKAYIALECERMMKIFAKELIELRDQEGSELLPNGAEFLAFINKMMAEVKDNMGHKSEQTT